MTALTLDHLVVAVRDLDRAAESYVRLLGRAPSWRGRHPQYGTANVLFRLDNGYLELLAPTDDGVDDSPWLRALRERLDTAGEGLYAIALGTEEIDSAVACARERGLEVLDPADGDGVDLDSGARREWRNARIASATTRGIGTFLIQHRSPPDALPVARPCAENGVVVGFDHIVIASSQLPATLRVWQEALGLDRRLTVDGPNGRQLHFLRLGESILELAGEAERPGPDGSPSGGDRDLLWGVAYRVDSVAQTVARLRADGVDVSDPRPGNAPATVVADLKPGFSHDVRTLLIEKEARV